MDWIQVYQTERNQRRTKRRRRRREEKKHETEQNGKKQLNNHQNEFKKKKHQNKQEIINISKMYQNEGGGTIKLDIKPQNDFFKCQKLRKAS